jgi:putative NADH-flavin reductase
MAFVRSLERLKLAQNRIAVKQGDLLNSIELERAIDGHDTVSSAFGPRAPIEKADANLLRNFAISLTTAMPRELTKDNIHRPSPCQATNLLSKSC